MFKINVVHPLLAAWLLAGLGPGRELHTDGHGIAPTEETSRFYDCGEISGTIRYRIERFDHAEFGEGSRRLTSLGLAVNGRDLPASELAVAEGLLRGFGEVEGLGSNCVNDFLEIRVWGVTIEALAHYIRTGEQPEPELRVMRLSGEGIVFVR